MNPNPSDNICILVASHISNGKRIGHLMNCLKSLLNQTYAAVVYLSISFESDSLRNTFLRTLDNDKHILSVINYQIFIKILPQKTAQMRHIELLIPIVKEHGHSYVLFCDDDDAYEPDRVKIFRQAITETVAVRGSCSGVYESTFGKTHREHRHEFWCYCVHVDLLAKFVDVVNPSTIAEAAALALASAAEALALAPAEAEQDHIMDHSCCDILFAEYLRRSGNEKAFSYITQKLYQYRVDNNEDSVTGVIQTKQKTVVRRANPPNPMTPEYLNEWNEYLHENLSIYLHDTFLRTCVRMSFENILQEEFKEDFPYLDQIDACHVTKLKAYYDQIDGVCKSLYDIY